MSKEKRRVPKLRFPGFTEDWEQRKLTDIAKTFIGLVTTMTENYRDSGTLLIRNSDIKEGQFIFSEKPIHLDEEFAEKNKTRRLQIGDVVTVHTGEIGTSAVIKEKEAGAIGFATINTRTDKRILNPYFLSTYFNTDKHKCYANSVSTGDGRSNYNIKDFNKLVISIPTLDEQEKISAIINNINTIITLHQRKLDNLKLKKKALLQKLFPKNGEYYPELRFPGFTDAWEQRKLGDVTNIKTGSRNQQDSVTNGQYPFFIRSEKIEKLDRYDFDTEAILVPGDGRIGEIFHYYNGKFALHQRVYKVDNFKGVDAFFLLYLFQCSFKEHALRLNAQGTVPSLRLPMFTEWNICIPSLQEQIGIGRLLNKIELMITLHQRKLDHLQLQKKALLQQMFV